MVRRPALLSNNEYVRVVDERRQGRVKPLIRLIKAWKFFNSAPIQSFYLEMYVTKYASDENAIIYPIDVRNILENLAIECLPTLVDPMGISGSIEPCSSISNQSDALSRLRTAADRAQKATSAEYQGNIRGALGWWNELFGSQFPLYG